MWTNPVHHQSPDMSDSFSFLLRKINLLGNLHWLWQQHPLFWPLPSTGAMLPQNYALGKELVVWGGDFSKRVLSVWLRPRIESLTSFINGLSKHELRCYWRKSSRRSVSLVLKPHLKFPCQPKEIWRNHLNMFLTANHDWIWFFSLYLTLFENS